LDPDLIKDLDGNYLTQCGVAERGLRDYVDEVSVKPHWLRRNINVLSKAYQNIFEIVENHFKVKLIEEKNNVMVHVALPLTEHAETFTLIAKNHQKACQRLGFRKFSDENQLFLSSKGEFALIEKQESVTTHNIRLVVDIGSYDSKVVAFSSRPIQSTARRETIGGQNVQKHAIKMSKKMHPQPKPNDVIKWLNEHAHVYDRIGKRVLKYSDQDLDIAPLLNSPLVLFYPKNYNLDKKSLPDLITEVALAATRLTGGNLTPMFLSCVLLTGGGAKYHGIDDKLKDELSRRFQKYKQRIKVYRTKYPEFSCLRGFKQILLDELENQPPVQASLKKVKNKAR
jgi:actin-related protein